MKGLCVCSFWQAASEECDFMYIADNDRDNVLGRDWIRLLHLDILKFDKNKYHDDCAVYSVS